MLHEYTGRSTRFIVVKHGNLIEESKVPQDGYEEIQVFNPSTNLEQPKWIKRYDSVSGYIKKIEWRDTGRDSNPRYLGFHLVITDDGEDVVIDLPFDRSPYRAFTKFIGNVDFAKPVTIAAWQDRKTASMVLGCKQDEKWVRHMFTKDNPQGCPPPEEGLGKLDFRKQQVWLKERIDKYVIPAVEAAQAARDAATVGPSAVASATTEKAKAANASDPFPDEMFKQVPKDEDAPATLADDDSVPF